MIKNIDRIPLLSIQFGSEPISPLKPHIKILKKKLPVDFFTGQLGIHSCSSVVRNSERLPPTTSSQPRKIVKQEYVGRNALTARDYADNRDEELIMGVLKNARQMKRVFRKHSIQLKKQEIIKRKQNQFDLQLPPLLLKKGATSAF